MKHSSREHEVLPEENREQNCLPFWSLDSVLLVKGTLVQWQKYPSQAVRKNWGDKTTIQWPTFAKWSGASLLRLDLHFIAVSYIGKMVTYGIQEIHNYPRHTNDTETLEPLKAHVQHFEELTVDACGWWENLTQASRACRQGPGTCYSQMPERRIKFFTCNLPILKDKICVSQKRPV